MSFTIIPTTNGKPHMVINGYKYREAYIKKSGDVTWRCLGKTCGSAVTTNPGKTLIVSTKPQHSGHHPVTMRRLLSPGSRPSSPSTSLSPAATADSPHPTPSLKSATSTSSLATPGTSSVPSTTPALCRALDSSPESLQNSSAHLLALENSMLKEQMSELTNQYKCVLDHSIESDQRLLRYTDEVFVADCMEKEETPSLKTSDCAVQCGSTGDVCEDRRCISNRELVESLKTTVEVLEAEVLSLKIELANAGRASGDESISGVWTVQTRRQGVRTHNKFEALQTAQPPCEAASTSSTTSGNNTGAPKRNNTKSKKLLTTRKAVKPDVNNMNQKKTPSPKNLIFDKVLIEGDSHARHLADILQQRVGRNTVVTGLCKPGARLLSVTSGDPPPSGSCCILFAGTNDVAAGEASNIHRHLERQITSRLSSASVIVSTIPHRHDLPGKHPVNQQTALTNAYIKELGTRLGIEVLDFNSINRRWFTRHGMHLRTPGKRVLVELMLNGLIRASRPDGLAAPLRPGSEDSTSCSPQPQPVTLPYNSFADAVKTATPCSSSYGRMNLPFPTTDESVYFLGDGQSRALPV